MATQTRVPTSDAGPNNFTPSSGSDNYAMVDDPVGVPDDATTELTKVNSAGSEDYGFTAFAISSSAI